MSKIAFLFPGQGSQFVGMGKELYAAFPKARQMYEQAEQILEFPLRELSFEGPEEELRQTCYTQPAIFVHSLVVDALIKEKGLQPEATAGHSLGEYSALVSAGALRFEDGLHLVKIRGALMQVAGEKNPGTMAAILGSDEATIRSVCEEASADGVVQPANFNSPGQIVISGSVDAVHRAMALAKERGARLARELGVSGAFHSPLMGDALEGLIDALSSVPIAEPKVPVYSNVEARPMKEPEHIREMLRQQLLSPVLWETIIRNQIADGYDQYYEVGPGKVLQGLMKRIDRQYPCQALGGSGDIEAL